MSAQAKRIRDRVQKHLGEDAEDELFAIAMTRICEGFPPACSDAFTCLHDGDCFRPCQQREAAKLIEAEARKQEGGVRAILLAAARAVRADKIEMPGKVIQWP